MAKRTIQSCWKQFEKLVAQYLDESRDQQAAYEKIEDLTQKANADALGATLVTLFVKPFLTLELGVVFDASLEEDGTIPKWKTKYDGENSRILVNPISAVQFIRYIQELELTEEDQEEFLHCRWLSFLKEIAKLPTIYVFFMLILQRVAYLLEIAHLEKRGGVIEVAEDEAYHTFLWAFKEMESFALKTWGVQLRSHHGMSWYESEWITGR